MNNTINAETVKNLVTIGAPLVKSLFDTYVVPGLTRLIKRMSLDHAKYHTLTEEHFNEYLLRSYKKQSFINTLVFKNTQCLLKDIFVGLTITNGLQPKPLTIKIEGYPSDLVNHYERLLIVDNAGMGKSTLVKMMFLDCVDSKAGIPLLIELRRLSRSKKIAAEIHEQINALHKDFDQQLLLELLSEGGFIIFLDGFDEISLSEREAVILDLQEFVSKAGKNKFILTSRPENALASFGDFREFNIEPLKKEEAFELLEKYDQQGEISALLISRLQGEVLKNVEDFLANPLLVSLLYTAFQHKQVIPFKKHLFYRQVFDAHFDAHDLTKGAWLREKHSGLNSDDFNRVLRHLAYSCLKTNERIEFSKDEMLALINGAKVFCKDLIFHSSDFFNDLLTTVPLFSQDGVYFKWRHKSLQEYFAAQFIHLDSKLNQPKILLSLYNSENAARYLNILDLYFDIDPKGFRTIILYAFLKQFKAYYETSYTGLPWIDRDAIRLRKELTFMRKIGFCYTLPGTHVSRKADMIMMPFASNPNSVVYMSGDPVIFLCVEEVSYLLFTSILMHRIPEIAQYHDLKVLDLNILRNIIPRDEEIYFVTDDPTSVLNERKNFKLLHGFMASYGRVRSCINSKYALRLLTEIEKEISEGEQDEVFA